MKDYGSVDLFGLDEFGAPVGIAQPIGAAVGAASQWGAALAVKKWTKQGKYAEGIGALAGAAAGGAMMLYSGTRAAGWTALAAALVGGGLRQLEASVMKTNLGLVEIQPAPVVSGFGATNTAGTGFFGADGMGIPTLQPAPVVNGLEMPPQLVGAGDYGMSQNPAAQQAVLVGTTPMGMASHYGGTIFG